MLKTKGVRPYRVYMAMLGTNGSPAYQFSPCKEYALDCVYSSVGGRGHFYSNHYGTVSLERVQIVVQEPAGWAENSLQLINMVEKVLGTPPTKLRQRGYEGVFTGNRRWLISPPMLSLYTLLIRTGWFCDSDLDATLQSYSICKGGMGGVMATDATQFNQARPGLEYILTYGDRFVFGDDMITNWRAGNDIHDRGIVNFSRWGLYHSQPNWYRKFKTRRF